MNRLAVGYNEKFLGARRSPLVRVSGLSCLFSPPILPLYADCGPFLEIPSKGNRGQLGIHNRELASTEDLDFVKISKVEDLDFLFPTCHKINTLVFIIYEFRIQSNICIRILETRISKKIADGPNFVGVDS